MTENVMPLAIIEGDDWDIDSQKLLNDLWLAGSAGLSLKKSKAANLKQFEVGHLADKILKRSAETELNVMGMYVVGLTVFYRMVWNNQESLASSLYGKILNVYSSNDELKKNKAPAAPRGPRQKKKAIERVAEKMITNDLTIPEELSVAVATSSQSAADMESVISGETYFASQRSHRGSIANSDAGSMQVNMEEVDELLGMFNLDEETHEEDSSHLHEYSLSKQMAITPVVEYHEEPDELMSTGISTTEEDEGESPVKKSDVAGPGSTKPRTTSSARKPRTTHLFRMDKHIDAMPTLVKPNASLKQMDPSGWSTLVDYSLEYDVRMVEQVIVSKWNSSYGWLSVLDPMSEMRVDTQASRLGYVQAYLPSVLGQLHKWRCKEREECRGEIPTLREHRELVLEEEEETMNEISELELEQSDISSAGGSVERRRGADIPELALDPSQRRDSLDKDLLSEDSQETFDLSSLSPSSVRSDTDLEDKENFSYNMNDLTSSKPISFTKRTWKMKQALDKLFVKAASVPGHKAAVTLDSVMSKDSKHAAQVFYQALVLASTGDIMIHQNEVYGTIYIEPGVMEGTV